MKSFTEEDIGIRGYITSNLKVEGRIKTTPDAFVVDEIPIDFKRSENGKYLYLRVRLYNWDTNHFLNELARALRISRKRVSYAGAKDKRAVTTQYFCINSEVENVTFGMKDVEFIEQFRSSHMLRLGDLLGNRFAIKVESDKDQSGKMETISGEIVSSGFPNFFGPQRFGSFRPNTHKVGKLIVMGKTEDAVDEYLCDRELDDDWFRREYLESGDVQKALRDFPRHLSNERSLLQKIAEGRKDSALEALPLQLRMLFVHAYQSFIFNRIVSKRLEQYRSVREVLESDTCVPVDNLGNPLNEVIKVTAFNLPKIRELVRTGKAAITAPLPGYNSEPTGGEAGKIERDVFEEESLELQSFRIPNYPELSSSGTIRAISGRITDFTIPEQNTAAFSLGKGMYATSVIREFVKDSRLDYFSGMSQEENRPQD